MELHVYLHFNGNCKEALDLYSTALNGKVGEIHTYAECPAEMKSQLPENWHNKIMHAEFKAGNIFILASDVMPGSGHCQMTYTPETGPVSLSLNCTSEAEQKEVFDKLAVDGKVTMELQDTFWGAKFGMLTDKFGTKWMFHFDKTK